MGEKFVESLACQFGVGIVAFADLNYGQAVALKRSRHLAAVSVADAKVDGHVLIAFRRACRDVEIQQMGVGILNGARDHRRAVVAAPTFNRQLAAFANTRKQQLGRVVTLHPDQRFNVFYAIFCFQIFYFSLILIKFVV